MNIFQSGAQFVKVATFTANVGTRPSSQDTFFFLFFNEYLLLIFITFSSSYFVSLSIYLLVFLSLVFFLHVVCFLHLSVSNDNTFCQVNPLIIN